jgi:hypothetical protein
MYEIKKNHAGYNRNPGSPGFASASPPGPPDQWVVLVASVKADLIVHFLQQRSEQLYAAAPRGLHNNVIYNAHVSHTTYRIGIT